MMLVVRVRRGGGPSVLYVYSVRNGLPVHLRLGLCEFAADSRALAFTGWSLLCLLARPPFYLLISDILMTTFSHDSFPFGPTSFITFSSTHLPHFLLRPAHTHLLAADFWWP